jgi:outer membrane protein assembly factor BamB
MSRRQALSLAPGAGLVAVTGCGAVPAARANGTQANGTQANGTQANGTRASAGRLIWRAQVAASTDEPVLITAGGLVYAGISGAANGDARTFAITAATGRLAWRTPGSAGPRPYAASPGAVFGFTVTRGGATDVVATSAASGHTLWTHDAGPLLNNAKVGWLTYGGGLVYVAAGTTENNTAGQPTVRALDARTGRRAWAVTLGTGPQEPTLAGGVLYTPDVSSALASTGRVAALQASTGARRWTSASLAGMPGLLVVTGGAVCGTALTATAGASIFGLDSGTGRRLWERESGAVTIGGTDGMVFLMPLSAGQTTLSAWHARSGRTAWSRTVPAGAAAVAAGSVLYLASGRTLTALVPATGSVRWTYQLGAAVVDMTASSNAVYALDAHGGVSALRV